MRYDDLCLAWAQDQLVDQGVHSRCHVAPRLRSFDPAVMIEAIIIGCWAIASIQPLLWLATGNAVADFAQRCCLENWLAKPLRNGAGGLRRASEVGTINLYDPLAYPSFQPLSQGIGLLTSATGQVTVVPAADRVLQVMRGLGVGHDENFFHKRRPYPASPRLLGAFDRKRKLIAEPTSAPHPEQKFKPTHDQ